MFKQFVPTEAFIFTEKTKLNSGASAGQTALMPSNSGGFVQNDFFQLGWSFDDQAELCKVSAAGSVTSITTAANLSFAHKRNEPLTKMLYDQRKLYGCATETGTYVYVTSSIKTIEVDNPEGTWLEDTGSTYSFYKATYYNSVTATETALADAPIMQPENVEGQEPAVTALGKYCTLADVRAQAGFEGVDAISDTFIDYKRKRAQAIVDSYIGKVYTLPLDTIPENIKFITSMLASAFLLIDEYGSSSRDTDKDGYKRMGEAMKMLREIKDKEAVLFDNDGVVISSGSTGTVSFYPNDSTEPESHFSIDMTKTY